MLFRFEIKAHQQRPTLKIEANFALFNLMKFCEGMADMSE